MSSCSSDAAAVCSACHTDAPPSIPDVSVLLPVFNAASTVTAAVDSLLAQDCPALEIIAADDGSTDGTGPLLDALAARDRRLRVLHLPHQGIAGTLNAGLAAARGRFIARMDADDVSLPGRLRRQRDFLDAHPETGLVSCLVRFGGDARRAGGFARLVDWMNACRSNEELRVNRFRETPIPHPSVMFRAELPMRHGGYREGPFPEDWELWLRWMDAGVRMEKLPETLLVWNDPPGRLTRTDAHYAEAAFTQTRALWLARHLLREGRREVCVIGGGRVSRRRALPLQAHGIRIRAWVDIDPHKIGNMVHGIPVIARDALPAGIFILICLTGHGAPEEAAAWLRSRGLRAGRDYLIA